MKKFCALILVASISSFAVAQQRVAVNPDVRHQTIEFFGAADAWSANFVGKLWSDNAKKEIAD